jgi:hypothetical protein
MAASNTNSKRSDLFCICRKPYDKDILMVQCDECEEWFHPHCVGRTDEYCVNANKFHCPTCESNILDRIATLESTMAAHTIQLTALSTNMVELGDKVDSKADKETVATLAKCVVALTAQIPNVVAKLERAMDEPLEREKKACNIIIRNLESTDAVPDETKIANIMRSLDVTGSIGKHFRFGPPTNRFRPVKVEFGEKSTAQLLINRASRLKGHAEFGKVYLNADITKYQQQALDSELQRHFEAGENYTIIGNRCVPFRGATANPRFIKFKESQAVTQAHGDSAHIAELATASAMHTANTADQSSANRTGDVERTITDIRAQQEALHAAKRPPPTDLALLTPRPGSVHITHKPPPGKRSSRARGRGSTRGGLQRSPTTTSTALSDTGRRSLAGQADRGPIRGPSLQMPQQDLEVNTRQGLNSRPLPDLDGFPPLPLTDTLA